MTHETEPVKGTEHSYWWTDKNGNRHGPYHNYRSAEHAKKKWEEAGLD